MIKLCMEAIDKKQLSILKQIMLKFPHFLELYHNLHEKDFTFLLTAIEYQIVGRHQSLFLRSDRLYFFSGAGVMFHKQILVCTNKSIGMYSKIQTFSGNSCQRTETQQASSYQIRQFDSYQDKIDNNQIQSQDTYYNSGMTINLLLSINTNCINKLISLKLQGLYHQKLNCLLQNSFFRAQQRYLIQRNLHKFRFMCIKFNQLLYSNNSTEDLIFFIKNGAVQISYDQSNQAGIRRVYGCCNLIAKKQQSAKCISSILHYYVIDKITLQNIQNKVHSSIQKRKTTMGEQFPIIKNLVREQVNELPSFQNNQVSHQSSRNFRFSHKKDNLTKLQTKKGYYKNAVNKTLDESTMIRRQYLRSHFSNFYNEIYDKFSMQKIKKLGLNMENKQAIVLYKIQIVQKKLPSMNQIKDRLKRIKSQKMKKFIQTMSKRNRVLEKHDQQ